MHMLDCERRRAERGGLSRSASILILAKRQTLRAVFRRRKTVCAG